MKTSGTYLLVLSIRIVIVLDLQNIGKKKLSQNYSRYPMTGTIGDIREQTLIGKLESILYQTNTPMILGQVKSRGLLILMETKFVAAYF